MQHKHNNKEAMRDALSEVLNKQLSICSAADKYNIPRVAIYRAIRAHQANTSARVTSLHNAKEKLENHIAYIQAQLTKLEDPQTP
ncbi:helix-turn-helix domain-containing protein [Pseudoalteromonas citrea]|nr:helix-turn-helix domain-containing protein [Pseudoalteromonas citrea]